MAKFLSKTEDDSTDISATEQSLWFARLVTEGTVRTEFLGCVFIHKTNAEGIVASLDKTLENNLFMPFDTLMNKVASVTIDGANVMVGKSPGENVRLQKYSPWILILHCMAHRLELAYKDTSNNIILYQKAVALDCTSFMSTVHSTKQISRGQLLLLSPKPNYNNTWMSKGHEIINEGFHIVNWQLKFWSL